MLPVPVLEKLKFLYPVYVLAIVSLGYVVGELGHYMIGVTSKETAKDLHYGDISCQLNNTELSVSELPFRCDIANNSETCYSFAYNGTPYCEWEYNGLGLDYQILAGPSFIAVFTIMGIFFGIVADRWNRIRMLAICTIIFSVATILMGAVKEFWHLVILRMILAAGEASANPIGTGILSDIFPEEKRALVMSIFNWGIYGGYGIAFPIGRYIPQLNAWDLGWRLCYYGVGIVGIIIGLLTGLTISEPERKIIGEETTAGEKKKKRDWKVLFQPRVLLLCLAASIRHTGGMAFGYNCDLYYREYFPDYDLGWWLFAVTVVVGSIGVVAGGVISDKFVSKMGIKSRVLVLAISQLIASPFAFGSVYFDPLGAMITLGISYFFAEMWFGIVFAILVEVVPLSMRSTTVGVFLFVMNNVGGNLPILIEPIRTSLGFREALYIFYAGFYLISSVLFLITVFFMEPKSKDPRSDLEDMGHENPGLQVDASDPKGVEMSRL
ncbi:hypothetical protein RUM43_006106 [Polyplax serrata]|uniref:Major facilitator superfamily (MFS) profile domain-containing protein n=1 Tax=Polyplax serrata TaxID=468196 RepID=A0AAN8NXA5_POLSC